MIAVIFELQAADGQRDTYLELAAALKPLLAQIDGFISIERFQSLADPARLLSLSFGATKRRCNSGAISNSTGRRRGRGEVLAQYRLRVAEVVRDYGLESREQAPQDSRCYHANGKPASEAN